MTHSYLVKKDQLLAFLLFSIIILETSFGNTPLQIYNLTFNRILFFVELLIFVGMISVEKFSKNRLLLSILIASLFILSYFFIDSALLLKMFMTAISVAIIGESRSFKILFKYKITFLSFIILLSLIGIIPNMYTVVEKGIGTRYGYTLGFTHPNRLASSVMSLILCFICWKNKKLKLKDMMPIILAASCFYFITKSRTLLFGIIIFLILFSLYKFSVTSNIIKKILTFLGVIALPVCIGLSIAIPFLLLSSSGTLQKIVYFVNLMFSRRFTNIEHMFLTYPITFTGGLFDTSQMDKLFEYSVVDNGYIRFLYQYGILGLALLGGISFLSVLKIIREKEFIWLITFIIVAILGLLENIYTDIGLNTFVIFWAGVLSISKRKNQYDTKKNTLYMVRE